MGCRRVPPAQGASIQIAAIMHLQFMHLPENSGADGVRYGVDCLAASASGAARKSRDDYRGAFAFAVTSRRSEYPKAEWHRGLGGHIGIHLPELAGQRPLIPR
jgi:hypothetical protein